MLSESLVHRAAKLQLHGIINQVNEIKGEGAVFLEQFITWEEAHRSQRSLDGRLRRSKLERFKSMADFDWGWPKQCDRDMVELWLELGFMEGANNLILCGPNGVGKTMIAKNIAFQSVLKGHTALFTTAAEMLTDLADLDSERALRSRIKYYAQPGLLILDEVGQLSYSNRHADLLFQVIAQRYEKKSTCITTNRPFAEWSEIFPNATCVVSIIDRLIHHSEILNIDGESFRFKEATEKNQERTAKRAKKTCPVKEKL